ncbi:ABC transporter substrate-binding protein [Salibacter halophilus]|uniref:ABC transporter substrate-binding protein n=1 Tax=Salibacter halophilus TaxID=1803916 RepID=A0A6N6M7H0_9FLAO|nr:helical backbone metal receptor [Salibacter halophilus]KAB1062720.1 ABC transporter substrate-binding protein [Salibacter halophilus]
MSQFTDQVGYQINLKSEVNSIVSTVPSQTELLFDLGLGSKVKGVTRFCVHPKNAVADIPKIGGTKNLDIEKIRDINPDLIIGNKEENIKEQVEKLKTDFPVWLSDIKSPGDALDMMTEIGEITQTKDKAVELVNKIQQLLDELAEIGSDRKRKALVFIWKDPYMVAGRDTYMHEVLKLLGYETAIHRDDERYPQVTMDQIEESEPDLLLFTSEPFPYSSRELQIFQEKIPNCKKLVVNGEYFSWYGSRMIKSFQYFKQLKRQLNT